MNKSDIFSWTTVIKYFKTGVYKLYTTQRPTVNFLALQGWHEAISILSTAKIFRVTVQNWVARANWRLGFVRPCFKKREKNAKWSCREASARISYQNCNLFVARSSGWNMWLSRQHILMLERDTLENRALCDPARVLRRVTRVICYLFGKSPASM